MMLGMNSTRGKAVAVALVAAISVVVIIVLVVQRRDSNPCAVLAERQLFDGVSDYDTTGGRPLLDAVKVALTKAGIQAADVEASDLDPVVRGDGNVVHVGVKGYWIMLGEAPGGYVTVTGPRLCSKL
jgi:hypothetical protein